MSVSSALLSSNSPRLVRYEAPSVRLVPDSFQVTRRRTVGDVNLAVHVFSAGAGSTSAAHAIADAVHSPFPGSPACERGNGGVVVAFQSNAVPGDVCDLERVIDYVESVEGIRSAAVGLVVLGEKSSANLADLAVIRRLVHERGGYVVGSGLAISRRQAVVQDVGSDAHFGDVTVVSEIGLLARRVATLARSGRSLR